MKLSVKVGFSSPAFWKVSTSQLRMIVSSNMEGHTQVLTKQTFSSWCLTTKLLPFFLLWEITRGGQPPQCWSGKWHIVSSTTSVQEASQQLCCPQQPRVQEKTASNSHVQEAKGWQVLYTKLQNIQTVVYVGPQIRFIGPHICLLRTTCGLGRTTLMTNWY